MSTPQRVILGVDPGASGAIAFLFADHPERVSVEDMPVVNGGVSGALLASRLKQMAPTEAIVEAVGARPGQGVSSMFKFGHATGVVHGVIGALEIPVRVVAPASWKKHFRLTADKEQARALAIARFPVVADRFQRVRDHGRAESALIALYILETTS